ncbi:MAG: hypothetical protein SFW62_01840 [Alphaproteobacteria bacterium]|nr:hypothetical protein [Alphaproteobacteria bacterium]
MPKKATTNIEKKLTDAALKLAARREWNLLTLEEIARTAKLPLAQVKKLFPGTDAILPAIVGSMDAQTAAAFGKAGPQGAPHDRLFEVMMARFDALQEHRRAILGIIASARRNPKLARPLLPAQLQAMEKMLTLARLKPGGPAAPLAAAGLLAVYAFALCSWRGDNSSDMAKTMAALDRALRHAGKAAEILFRAVK